MGAKGYAVSGVPTCRVWFGASKTLLGSVSGEKQSRCRKTQESEIHRTEMVGILECIWVKGVPRGYRDISFRSPEKGRRSYFRLVFPTSKDYVQWQWIGSARKSCCTWRCRIDGVYYVAVSVPTNISAVRSYSYYCVHYWQRMIDTNYMCAQFIVKMR